jgi:hypothetical protein
MHIDLTAAEIERARSLTAPPFDPARLALLGAKRPRPVAELIADAEAEVECLAALIARLRGREWGGRAGGSR